MKRMSLLMLSIGMMSSNCFAYGGWEEIPQANKKYVCEYVADNGQVGKMIMDFKFRKGIKPTNIGSFDGSMALSLTLPFEKQFEAEYIEDKTSIDGEYFYSLATLGGIPAKSISDSEQVILQEFLGSDLHDFSGVFGEDRTMVKILLNQLTLNKVKGVLTLNHFSPMSILEKVEIEGTCHLE
jgi:hypothetical protein